MSTLSVETLNKRYKSRIVVHDVSLAVDSGEVIGLLGPNGAGKTTCFYMIVGLVATDGGTIRLDGENLTRMPIHVRARLGLSYLPQEASIFRKLSVAENIQAILELQGIDEDEIANRLRTKATDMVQKLGQGGNLADEAASIGAKVETASGFKRQGTVPGVPEGLITAAFRTAKDSAGQTPGTGGTEWFVFRVTDVTAPAADLASSEMKSLKDTLQRSMVDEQLGQYVVKLQKDIGTSINEVAFAQVTGREQ